MESGAGRGIGVSVVPFVLCLSCGIGTDALFSVFMVAFVFVPFVFDSKFSKSCRLLEITG